MGYWKKRYKFKNAIEVEEGHSARLLPPGMKRAKRVKPTTEQMAEANRRNREKKCRRKLRQHFVEGDYFVCLTYRKEERPAGMEGAKEDFRKFMRKVRKKYKRAGAAVKWIRNIEVGKKNGWHIHLVINRIPGADLILTGAWKHGKVAMQLLYEKGGFVRLAAYITKAPETDSRLKDASYSASRNLPLPEPEKREYRKWKTWNRIRIPKGFYLDKSSVHEGKNPYTGYPYREYTLLRIRRE